VKAEAGASSSKKLSSLTTRTIRGEIILPFNQVSSTIRRLVELLNNASICILFDEWSEVDKDPQVQPYLAEMLRRTASAVPGMYLKLACIPGRTLLATPVSVERKNPIGLQEGNDIHPDINLDSIVFARESLDQLVPYFMAMIKKHVGQKSGWVRRASFNDFELFLMSTVFDGEPPFLELCQASGGVPRDFINIYRSATTAVANTNKSKKVRPALDILTVRLAAKIVYQSKRASFGKSTSPQLQLLDAIYREIYVNKHSYFFLLSEESAEDDVVQTLYMEKLIHRIPATYYNPDDEQRYQFFQLDYGTTIDRLMANAESDARTSFQAGSLGPLLASVNHILSRETWLRDNLGEDIGWSPWVSIGSFAALSGKEVGRIDIDPREIIFA
jgi:hypothetical protein